jgi:flagellar basal-body rod modification protein FlgD
MIAQLAQFSSLEQLQNMSGALQQNLDINLAIGQMLANTLAATLLGKEVHVATDRVTVEAEAPPSLGYRLQGDAHRVEVDVYDANGTLVRTLSATDTTQGVHALEWDGKDAEGRAVASGEYRFEVRATRADGSTVDSNAMLVGRVSAIRYADGGAQVLIGATSVLLGDIEQILAD